ncbi:MAG TPA: PAS domain-containing protein [Anaerolineales bacterium]|nr:PAS domain-containing protein [Anaerolineales bacterium]
MPPTDRSYLLGEGTDKKIIRAILFGLSFLILLGIGIVFILQLRDGNTKDASILALGIVPILGALGFAYHENTEISGAIIAGSLTVMITVLATIGQGVYDIGTMAYPAILIIASLILRRNTVGILALIIILSNGWLVFGAIYGIYTPTYPQQSYERQFVITALILIVTMLAVYILSNTLRKSLATAQNELLERQRVEQALREAETMYRALVEQTTIVTYRDIADMEASPLYISPQIENLTGYTAAEWMSKPDFWKTLVHPDDIDGVQADLERYVTTGARTISEYRLKTKDNRWVWVRDEAIVIKDDNGKPQYVHGVYIDITDQKTAELKVKQRGLILNAVAETAQLLLKTRDWRDKINTILKLLGQATGASHAYIFINHPGKDGVTLSSQKYEWTAPSIKPELDNPIYQNTRLVTIPGIEDWYANLSAGKPFYGTGKQYPKYWEKALVNRGVKTLLDMPIIVNGKWWGIIGFDDFINEMPWSQAEIDALVAAAGNLGTAIERQEIDEGLRASEEKFNLAFRHTHVAMAITKVSDHTLLDVNDAFCRVTGYSQQDAIGKRAGRDLNIWINSEDRNTIIDRLEQQGYIEEYKAQFRRKNEEVGTGLLSALNITISGEACQLYSFVDISNIDQLLNELESKNDELQTFTYTVSHDLKAPLVTISGFMGFLEKDARNGDTEKLNKDILRINEALSKMERLLTELLALSRIGRIMNPPMNVSYGEIVDEALELIQGRLQAEQVQVEVEAGLPSVYGDRARLVEVVQNLVENAAKFTKGKDSPKIEIGCKNTDGKPVFFVRDNGIGIEPQQHERIFGLFNKLDANSEGTGIGLALVRRIIEVHGGRIWVESPGLGGGSIFYFTLADHPNNEEYNEE